MSLKLLHVIAFLNPVLVPWRLSQCVSDKSVTNNVLGMPSEKKRKKFQTIVKKVGGGSPQTQNKNLKLILDKSIGREGAKSVCQNLNIMLKV